VLRDSNSNSSQIAPHPHLEKYYQDSRQRQQFVTGLFDQSAQEYDWVAKMMSFGSGQAYRYSALRRAGLGPGMRILDVACGTGAVTHCAQQIVGDTGQVCGLDPSVNMLHQARNNRKANLLVQGMAEWLPVRNSYFDVVSMGYALRHVSDLRGTFREFLRILKPGGRMVILEISKPKSNLALLCTKWYLKSLVPWVTRVWTRNSTAEKMMRYYWETIEQCVPPDTIIGAMAEVGLVNTSRHVAMNIFSEYTGVKQS